MLGASPVLLAALVFGLIEGPASAAEAASGSAFLFGPLLLLALLLVIRDWVPAMRRLDGRADWIVLLCLIQCAVWVNTTPSTLRRTQTKRATAAIQSDLKNLESQEEVYFSDFLSYSVMAADLDFTHSDGTTVEIAADETSWSGRATHELVPGLSCVMYHGSREEALPTLDGLLPDRAGEMVCGPLPPLNELGPVGDWLGGYYEVLKMRLTRRAR